VNLSLFLVGLHASNARSGLKLQTAHRPFYARRHAPLGRFLQRSPFQNVVCHLRARLYGVRQHVLGIVLDERRNETTKEATLYAPETVSTLNSRTCENRHLASTLSGVVIAIEITTRVAAVLLTFHVDVRTSNDVCSNRASPYIAKYGCMTRRNSKTTNDFPERNWIRSPVSTIMSISTVSKHFFCSGTYRVGLNTRCTFPSSSVDLSTIRRSGAFVSPTGRVPADRSRRIRSECLTTDSVRVPI